MSDQLTPEDAAAAAIRSRIEALNAALAALVEPAAERWAHIKEACDLLSNLPHQVIVGNSLIEAELVKQLPLALVASPHHVRPRRESRQETESCLSPALLSPL